MNHVLQCPVCRNPLLLSPDGYQCSRNHHFDASREGYVNLLLANKKHSREPGDSKEMIRCRTRFLDLGLYNKAADGIVEAVVGALPAPALNAPCRILDAGCGEGFYLKRLKDRLAKLHGAPADYYGVDISKFAVRQATRRDRTMNWFVASIVDLPFAPSSLDVVLNVFSPALFPEFARVLRENGSLVIATPGPRHLNGLRKVIYPEAREHGPSTISEEAKARFALASEARITYPIKLATSEAIMDLLAMTPYYWNIDLKTKAGVEALDRLALDVDVKIRTFRKRSEENP